MSGQRHWMNYFGGTAFSGLLIVLGLLCMVITQFILIRLSMIGFAAGMGMIVLGAIIMAIHHLRTRGQRDN